MKKYFFTGLVVLLPIALTLMIIFFLIDFFTTPFIPIITQQLEKLQQSLPFTLPENLDRFIAKFIALILLCIFVFVLGVIARWFLVRNLLQGMHAILSRIPILRTVFHVSRDLFASLFSQGKKKAFKKPVMIPFAGPGNYCVGFLAGHAPEECQTKIKESLLSIFTPTAPHPISGFLFLVPEKDVQDIDLSNEDAVKFIVSCGLIVPENRECI